jgi:hypothetical protein
LVDLVLWPAGDLCRGLASFWEKLACDWCWIGVEENLVENHDLDWERESGGVVLGEWASHSGGGEKDFGTGDLTYLYPQENP